MKSGRIVKAISGFYYVEADGHVYQCRGRGVFRNQNISPLVGDEVRFQIDENDEGYILEIGKRKNVLDRPPIANIDQALIVTSAKEPSFSSLLLDRFLVLVESKFIDPVIYITKKDLLSNEELQHIHEWKRIYEEIGYDVVLLSTIDFTDSVRKDVHAHVQGKVSVVAGQSGVGKSSLLNAIDQTLDIKTDAISPSLGRGKHTTRHVELIQIADGFVADTPGFSIVDFDDIEVEELSGCFPEMRTREQGCKFRGCLHINEPKCAIKQAVEANEIATERYTHYLHFMEEIQERKPRY